jgi:hypothetical protein
MRVSHLVPKKSAPRITKKMKKIPCAVKSRADGSPHNKGRSKMQHYQKLKTMSAAALKANTSQTKLSRRSPRWRSVMRLTKDLFLALVAG